MTLIELVKALNALGYPLAYSHFKTSDDTPAPTIPFIVYYEEDSTNVAADNKVHKKIKNYSIDLYTEKKELQVEQKIEDLLDSHSIYYDTSDFYIDKEQLFQRSYQITLINEQGD
ncbi:hypothetical protein [Caryophanon tenue]|uniref:Prophage pi2 protein 38 n=1 Tax=Caryophanon tenue TaxID=33978 RepID=A0A1C0Y519_9BACL|nr:hypothetical protein [Caryophanon tenue]OCS82278.1 hypothetical protein A6M13_07540 [Caryophanon tenue]